MAVEVGRAEDPLVSDDQLDFNLIARQADREFLGSQERRQPETPFYHYTNEAGLTGILETQAIWATEYGKLNDPDELTRGELVIQDELDAMIRECPETTPGGWLCRHIEKARRGRRLVDIPDIDIYVASFSSKADLLGQWRAYANDGQGYAIGLSSLPLPTGEQAASKLASSLAIDFGPCMYDEARYRGRVRRDVLYVADALKKYATTYCHKEAQWERLTHEAVGATLARLATLVPFLKDAAYVEEQEWRLIMLGTPPEKRMRQTRYGEALYIEVSLKNPDRMDLHEVISGPKVSSLDLARSTLDRCGYGDVAVAKSRLPYR